MILSHVLWITVTALTLAEDIDYEIIIDCASGAVDTGTSKLSGLTDKKCQEACSSLCASVTTNDEAEECLGETELLGCLFDIRQMQKEPVDWCQGVHKEADGNETSLATSLVVKIGPDTLSSFGNGSLVSNVYLHMSLVKNELYKELCTSKHAYIGHSLEPFNQTSCSYSGATEIEGDFSMGKNIMTVDATQMVDGLYTANQDVIFFAEFADPTCKLNITSVDLVFSMKYKSGYSPAVSCTEIKSCEGCLAKGCHWCDWTGTVDFFLPDWLPDWEIIDEARGEDRGICGMNSAICKVALGKSNECGALPAISTVMAVATMVITAIVTLSS